jgi:hypothetical protein
MTKVNLTLEEKIDRSRDGRSQTWIIQRMNERGCELTDTRFSRKKKGHEEFTELELKALSEVLNTNFTV